MGVALQSSLCRTSVQPSIRVNPQLEGRITRATKTLGSARGAGYAGRYVVGSRLMLATYRAIDATPSDLQSLCDLGRTGPSG